MKSVTLRLTALAAALCLAGCSTITPKDYAADGPTSIAKAESAMAQATDWDSPAVVTEGDASIVIMTPFSLPEDVRARKIQLELEPGATVKDVVAYLGNIGVPVIVANQEAAAKEFYLPRYNGTLGQLLGAISRATDVWFTWNDGAILVSSTERIAVSVPQDQTFAEALVKGLDGMGVKNHAVTWQAGMASLELTPSEFRKVRQYLARLTDNAAFVTMQVAVVGVTLNQNAKQGVDWEKLQLSALRGGTAQDVAAWEKSLNLNQPTTGTGTGTGTGTTNNGTTGTTGTTAGTTVTDVATAVLSGAVQKAAMSGGALQGAIFTGRFNFSGMFNFLQTYGNAETKQNVLVKTVTGAKVEFKSLTQIPYVKEIGVTTSTNSNSSSNLGSTQTEKADDGITVELTPTYDAAANTVTVNMKLAIKAVLAFNQLSAGNQLGTLTQPTTAERSLTDILRMRPGQTMVVGGLGYDSVSNSYGSPLFLQGTKAESQALKLDRQNMFIVVRASVVRIGQLKEEKATFGAESYLDFAPPAAVPEVVKPAKVTNPAKAPKLVPTEATKQSHSN